SFLLHKHLHNLTEPYKEVFTLKVFGELKFKEIASIFGKSESWAKMTYYRAKEKLVYLINEEGSKWG
ncbi:MAG: RNA polymerase sigma factor, partial [Lachnospiraceae bacterium]